MLPVIGMSKSQSLFGQSIPLTDMSHMTATKEDIISTAMKAEAKCAAIRLNVKDVNLDDGNFVHISEYETVPVNDGYFQQQMYDTAQEKGKGLTRLKCLRRCKFKNINREWTKRNDEAQVKDLNDLKDAFFSGDTESDQQQREYCASIVQYYEQTANGNGIRSGVATRRNVKVLDDCKGYNLCKELSEWGGGDELKALLGGGFKYFNDPMFIASAPGYVVAYHREDLNAWSINIMISGIKVWSIYDSEQEEDVEQILIDLAAKNDYSHCSAFNIHKQAMPNQAMMNKVIGIRPRCFVQTPGVAVVVRPGLHHAVWTGDVCVCYTANFCPKWYGWLGQATASLNRLNLSNLCELHSIDTEPFIDISVLQKDLLDNLVNLYSVGLYAF